MSERLQDKFGPKLPWILPKSIRIPRIEFPVYREGKMALPSPGKSLALIAIYIFLFYLIAGGVYIYIQEPIAMGADANGEALWLYPSLHDAFIIESIVAAAIIFLAGSGFILLFNTTKHAFNYPYAMKIMVLGIVLSLLSFGLLQYMIDQKGGSL